MEVSIDIKSILIYLSLLIISLVILFFLFLKLKKFFYEPELYGLSKKEIQKKWQEIEALVARGDELSAKLAIIEADKLLDHTLKSLNFSGTTLGERLKIACYKYPKLKDVWPANILRNKIVHESNFVVYTNSARRSVGNYKNALNVLGVL